MPEPLIVAVKLEASVPSASDDRLICSALSEADSVPYAEISVSSVDCCALSAAV